jgi:uncharacterized protein YdeI (YjbR/CyaY-like superfamily)
MTTDNNQGPATGRAGKLPADLKSALARMSPSHRKEYVDWISTAKRPETRARRIAKAIAMIGQRAPHL